MKNVSFNSRLGKGLNNSNPQELIMGITKRSEYRYTWGDLDIISAIIVIIGIYLTTKNYSFGWVVAVIGILKQFSGK